MGWRTGLELYSSIYKAFLLALLTEIIFLINGAYFIILLKASKIIIGCNDASRQSFAALVSKYLSL